MKAKLTLPLLLLFLSCSVKEEIPQNWYKGNLHTHSYWSDGDDYPEMVMDWYKTQGYDFVSLSEHNIIAEGEKWKLIPKSPMHEEAFQKYLEKYSEDWVVYQEDSGRISVLLKTLEEYRTMFEEPGEFLILKAEEITDRYNGKPLHLNANNIQELIEPQHGNSVTEVLQNNINAVIDQRTRLGKPIMVHINHPNFGYAITAEDLISLKGEKFFEVYNGHPAVYNRGDSSRMGTEEMWDVVNAARLAIGENIVYGLATDDSHNYHLFGDSYSNAGRGWVMVNCDELTPETLINALEAGNFYSTSGVTLDKLAFVNGQIDINIRAETGITYTLELIGQRVGQDAEVLESISDTVAQFKISGDLQFARVRITSSKPMENPVYPNEVEMAWTQPVQPTSSN